MKDSAEKIYTDFLQRNKLTAKSNYLYREVFDQSKLWIDQHGIPHLLDEMSTDYLNNVLDFLNTRKRFIWGKEQRFVETKETLLVQAIKHKINSRTLNQQKYCLPETESSFWDAQQDCKKQAV
jgi:hypothetical protein